MISHFFTAPLQSIKGGASQPVRRHSHSSFLIPDSLFFTDKVKSPTLRLSALSLPEISRSAASILRLCRGPFDQKRRRFIGQAKRLLY